MTTPTLAQVHTRLEAVLAVHLDPINEPWRNVLPYALRPGWDDFAGELRAVLAMVSCVTCGGPLPCELDDRSGDNPLVRMIRDAAENITTPQRCGCLGCGPGPFKPCPDAANGADGLCDWCRIRFAAQRADQAMRAHQ